MLQDNVYSAFDGQVVFETEPYLTPMVLIAIEKIQAAIPSEGFGAIEKLFFEDFLEGMSRTISITFALKENAAPPLVRLQHFWEQASVFPRDWPALWELFQRTYDTGSVREEWGKALQGGVPQNMTAQVELSHKLPSEPSELEAMSDDDPFLLRGKSSTRKPSKQQEVKQGQTSNATP